MQFDTNSVNGQAHESASQHVSVTNDEGNSAGADTSDPSRGNLVVPNAAYANTGSDVGKVDAVPNGSASSLSQFDWTGITPEVERQARKVAARIHALQKGMQVSAIEIGKELLVIKDKLSHGKFGPWLATEFGWTRRTAQNYMSVAEKFGDRPELVSVVPQAAQYLLAARSTPDEVTNQIIGEVASGKIPSVQEVSKRVKQAETPARLRS